MMLISYAISTIMIMMIFIMNMLTIISLHKTKDREKMSPFECGFSPLSNSRTPFSIHFFSTMIMFLMFDIEITLMMPMPMTLIKTTLLNSTFCLFLLSSILILGLFMEWKEGSMNWK
uniref:NADH-ubiquinone oxidoreductase chain 3 n=1 Tax=Calophya californica TaxID=2047826 RepID=A0A343LDQ2_9HEMI|nr:NADH dehydrogenase subunit 3 [Calophya californica]ATN42477.1 NADH dehydrogenase subunit 3 [Calophya californica]